MRKNLNTLLKLFLIAGLCFIFLPPVSAVNERIDYGITKTGSINNAGEVNTYTFSAESSDAIIIRIARTSGDLWPRITLLGPSGKELKRAYGPSTTELSYTLTSPGTYTVLVDHGISSVATGDYSLFIQRINNPGNAKTVNFGSSVSGSIDTPGTVDTYSFSADSGDAVIVRISRTRGDLWPRITLTGPPGKELKREYGPSTAELSYTLSSKGIYTILVDHGISSVASGDYSLFTQLTPGSATAAAATPVVTATSLPVTQPATGPVNQQAVVPTGDTQTDYLFPLLIAVIIIGALVIAGMKFSGKQKSAGTVPHHADSGILPPSGRKPGTTVNHDVIISYSTHDKAVADAVCAGLEARKVPCWIAPRDILPGTNYQEAIVDAIDASKIMVLIFSTHSNESSHVLRELTRAVNRKVIIIPFRIEDILPSKSIEYLISVPHWLEAMTPPLEKHIEELGNTVRILLENERKKTT